MNNKSHCFPVRIYYEDTDLMGVVYYANYLKFFERARTEFLRSCGVEQDQLIVDECVAFVVRSIQVDYLKAAKFNDELEVVTTVCEQKRASFIFEQTIYRGQAKHEIICSAKVKVACVHSNTMKVSGIPTKLIEQINNDN